jgi:primary-amine oxidase
VTLPLTAESTATVIRAEPWENRPFIPWEYIADELIGPALSILEPVFADILASVVISPELKAAAEAEGSDTVYPYVHFTTNGLSVPGSTTKVRKFVGVTMIVAGPDDGWTMGMFKSGPLTYVYYYDLDTDVFTVDDLVFCPGAGNPTFESPQLRHCLTRSTLGRSSCAASMANFVSSPPPRLASPRKHAALSFRRLLRPPPQA